MAGCVKSDRPTWSWLNEMNLKHSSRGIELYSEQGADVRVLGNSFARTPMHDFFSVEFRGDLQPKTR